MGVDELRGSADLNMSNVVVEGFVEYIHVSRKEVKESWRKVL